MAAPKGHPKSGGRAPGTPNKATSDAREAISTFVNGNAHRLQKWLDRIAEDRIEDDKLIPGNPIKAFELFQSVIEYHIPKLARQEQTGDGGGPVKHVFSWDSQCAKKE